MRMLLARRKHLLIAAVGIILVIFIFSRFSAIRFQVDEEKLTLPINTAFDETAVSARLHYPLLPFLDKEVPVSLSGTVGDKPGNYELICSAGQGKHLKNMTLTVTVTDEESSVSPEQSESVESSAFESALASLPDTTAPSILLFGESEIRLSLGQNYEEAGYTACDDRDGDLTDQVFVSGQVNSQIPGAYMIDYSVSDQSGNEKRARRIVYVSEQSVREEETKEETGQQEESLPEKVATVMPPDKTIYLTFDDGPGKYTQKLLDVLDRYDVKVTFFVTNQFPDYQDMIKKEYEAGHTVAIHTYSHDFKKVYSSVDGYYDDLKQMSDICFEETGVRPTILRFPGGSSNAVSRKYCKGIMTALTASLEEKGYYYCDWNVDSKDAGGARSADAVYQNVIKGISGSNISVVLQHDIHEYSVDAVENIIKWGKENGYTFLPLTESSPMEHHHLNN